MTQHNWKRRTPAGINRTLAKAALWLGGPTGIALTSAYAATWMRAALRASTIAFIGALAVPALMGAQGGTQPSVSPEITKAADGYLKAVLAGNAPAVAATYTDNGIELPPGESAVRGRAAIEKHFRTMFSGPARITAFTFSHIESATNGSVGYDVGTYEQQLALPSGQTVTDVGKYVVILKRSQGEWKAAYVIYNSDKPVAH
jgi:ketosteroid isomerase-like protein